MSSTWNFALDFLPPTLSVIMLVILEIFPVDKITLFNINRQYFFLSHFTVLITIYFFMRIIKVLHLQLLKYLTQIPSNRKNTMPNIISRVIHPDNEESAVTFAIISLICFCMSVYHSYQSWRVGILEAILGGFFIKMGLDTRKDFIDFISFLDIICVSTFGIGLWMCATKFIFFPFIFGVVICAFVHLESIFIGF